MASTPNCVKTFLGTLVFTVRIFVDGWFLKNVLMVVLVVLVVLAVAVILLSLAHFLNI